MGTLKEPSDLYDAIVETLGAKLIDGMVFRDYNEFSVMLADQMILIEFEQTGPGQRGPDGRYGHEYHITIHAVLSGARRRAALEAVNLAAAVERVTFDCIWGLPSVQCKRPENIRSAPSMFQKGDEGYEAWGVSFNQRIYLGPSLLDDDPVFESAMIAINPTDSNDESQYSEVDSAGINSILGG